jgi:excisionase family DNA binding protein
MLQGHRDVADLAVLAAELTDVAERLAEAAAVPRASDPGRRYTVAEAAEVAKVHRGTAWRWIKEGRLPATRVGLRKYCVNEIDLVQLLATEDRT